MRFPPARAAGLIRAQDEIFSGTEDIEEVLTANRLAPAQQLVQHRAPPSAYRDARAVPQYRLIAARSGSQLPNPIELDNGRTVQAGISGE
jgi:hypothetical protein